MNIQIYRYGQPGSGGLLVGVTRHLPRGVRREELARLRYFDIWMPLLAPSRDLLAAYRNHKLTFPQFSRHYRTEMRLPAAQQVIRLLAATSRHVPVHLGCFCADPNLCHRSILQQLLVAAESDLPRRATKRSGFFSPACAMPEIED